MLERIRFSLLTELLSAAGASDDARRNVITCTFQCSAESTSYFLPGHDTDSNELADE